MPLPPESLELMPTNKILNNQTLKQILTRRNQMQQPYIFKTLLHGTTKCTYIHKSNKTIFKQEE